MENWMKHSFGPRKFGAYVASLKLGPSADFSWAILLSKDNLFVLRSLKNHEVNCWDCCTCIFTIRIEPTQQTMATSNWKIARSVCQLSSTAFRNESLLPLTLLTVQLIRCLGKWNETWSIKMDPTFSPISNYAFAHSLIDMHVSGKGWAWPENASVDFACIADRRVMFWNRAPFPVHIIDIPFRL